VVVPSDDADQMVVGPRIKGELVLAKHTGLPEITIPPVVVNVRQQPANLNYRLKLFGSEGEPGIAPGGGKKAKKSKSAVSTKATPAKATASKPTATKATYAPSTKSKKKTPTR